MSSYHVPDIVLSAIHKFSFLILTTLKGSYSNYPHFIMEDTEA